MNRPELLPRRADEPTDPSYHRRLVTRWREFDTDWKSVIVAVVIAALVIGLDVPVPA